MGIGIIGVGIGLPTKVVKNKDLEKISEVTSEWIVKKIGVKERRICTKDEALSDLVLKASTMALEKSQIKPEEIDLLIVAAHNHDYLIPQTATIVQNKLGAKNAIAFDIRGGCAGSIYAIITAINYIKADFCKNALIIGGEVHSKMVDWSDYRNSVFFADGAGAVVIGEVPDGYGFLSGFLGTYERDTNALIVEAGGSREPITKEAIDAKRHYLKMDGKKIWEFATTVFPLSIRKVAKKANIQIKDIDFVIPHQTNVNIIKVSMEKLGLSMKKTSYETLERYGNSAAGTVIIELSNAIKRGSIKRGNLVALTAFGAGLSFGALLFKWY